MDFTASARWSTSSSLPVRKKSGTSPTVGKLGVPGATSTNDWTALHVAAQDGDEALVQSILKRSVADINAQAGKVGQTPLYNAAFRGHEHIIKLLLDKGADPRKRTTQGFTAAKIADQFGHRSCANLLRNRMGRSSIFARFGVLRNGV